MIPTSVLTEAATRFSLDPKSIEPLGGFHQNVFLYPLPEPGVVLKFSPVTQLIASKREIAWIQHLKSCGLSLACPIRSHANHWIESIETAEQPFIVTAAEKVAGSPPNIMQEWEPHADLFTQWGAFLGAIHRETRQFHVPTELPDFPNFDEHTWWPSLTPDRDDPLYSHWEKMLDILQSWSRDKRDYGVIHGDLHAHNFHWHNGKITGFDFGDGEKHWYLYDLAIALYHTLDVFPREEVEKRNALAHNLWEGLRTGYSTAHPDPILSEERLLTLLNYRRLFSHLYLRIHLDDKRLTPKLKRFLSQQEQEVLIEKPVWSPR
ncbi:phosphotransferase [Bacillus sp. FSL W7-1360]